MYLIHISISCIYEFIPLDIQSLLFKHFNNKAKNATCQYWFDNSRDQRKLWLKAWRSDNKKEHIGYFSPISDPEKFFIHFPPDSNCEVQTLQAHSKKVSSLFYFFLSRAPAAQSLYSLYTFALDISGPESGNNDFGSILRALYLFSEFTTKRIHRSLLYLQKISAQVNRHLQAKSFSIPKSIL